MHPAIEELLTENVKFSPRPVVSEDGDFLSIFVRDCNCYADRVDCTLTLYKDDETDEVVGCKIKGISTLLKQMDASGICVQDEFRMTVLFLGWATTHKIQADKVEILHYLIDQFGNITARCASLDDDTQRLADSQFV